MREIKFRAWEKKEKKMYYPGDFPPKEETTAHLMDMDMEGMGLLFDGQPIACDECGSFAYLTPGRYILMQYTGLKDKNGKEIYEGDVYFNSGWTGGCKGIVVEWDEGGGFSCFCDGEYGEDPFEVEVIGNIHENPELLEK